MLTTASRYLPAKLTEHFIQLCKYGIVGLIALSFDYLSLVLLTEYAHLHYLQSATAGFIIGVIVNYILSTKFVFKHSKLTDKKAEFTLFAIIGMGGLFFNNCIMWFLTDIIFFHYTTSKLIATAIVFLWNFYARKLILFKD